MLVSLGFGVATYPESNLFLGPTDTYLRQLVDDDVDAETWEQDLCLGMSDWIEENDGDLRRNSWLLFLTQGTLLAGVVALVGAVIL